MDHKRRLPLWLPAIATLLAAVVVSYGNFKMEEDAIIADVSERKALDAKLFADLLGLVVKGSGKDQQQADLVQSAITERHRSTHIQVISSDSSGEDVVLGDNIQTLQSGKFDGLDPIVRSLTTTRDNQDVFPPKGIHFEKDGRNYLMHQRTFAITLPNDSKGKSIGIEAKVILVTDLTAATEPVRNTAMLWGASLLIAIATGIGWVLVVNVRPFEELGKSVQGDTPVKIRGWWPGAAAKLGRAIEQYRADVAENSARLEAALALAKRMAHEVETVNHIAVHDIKADLTALNKGSEVITETVEELQVYLSKNTDEILADGIDTVKFFADLNINSARNAFEVLDQRNKLYNLRERIEITCCPIADIFASLQASFSSESGELLLENNCPGGATVRADFSLMLGVFKNIVRNGFIHNDATFKSVSVRAAKVGKSIRFEIEDNGVGMPASYLQSWGATLGKSSQLSSDRGGSGTGLYSVRAVIEAHQGVAVSVESEIGKGTKFTLEFV